MALLESSSKSRCCVFTSAGDFHNVIAWGADSPHRKWDLVVAFYGEDDHLFEQLRSVSTAIVRSKGSKFQNLKKLLVNQRSLFADYDFIFVCDDDIHITSDQIDRLFEIAGQYQFWVCQPCFTHEGRVSHAPTNKLGSQIRLTNFVEVNCPLFRADKLFEFMEVYDGSLAGWGIDWWYSHYFNATQNRTFAVIDEVVVLNPYDYQRPGGVREIEKLQPSELRGAHWRQKSEELGISEYDLVTLAYIIDITGANQSERKSDPSASIAQVVFSELEQERFSRIEVLKESRVQRYNLAQSVENVDRRSQDLRRDVAVLAQTVETVAKTVETAVKTVETIVGKVDDISRNQWAAHDIAREVWFERQRWGLPYKIGKWLRSRR